MNADPLIELLKLPNPPTARQREVYDFIALYIDEAGWPPTIREISAHFGWSSTNAVADHLRALHRKGLIQWLRGGKISRGIKLTLAAPPPRLTPPPAPGCIWVAFGSAGRHATIVYASIRHWIPATKETPARRASGERQGNARLTGDAVTDIRRRARAGESYAAIARVHGILPCTARQIAIGKSWASHKTPYDLEKSTCASRDSK